MKFYLITHFGSAQGQNKFRALTHGVFGLCLQIYLYSNDYTATYQLEKLEKIISLFWSIISSSK